MTDSTPPIPPPPVVGYEDVDPSAWWLDVLAGSVLVVLGLALIANPFAAIWILGVLVGASLVVGGVAELLASGHTGRSPWVGRVVGAISILAGIVAAAWPEATVWVLAVVVGLTLVVAGAVGAVLAMATPEVPHRILRAGLGVASVAVGALVLAWPDATVEVLAILAGIRAVLTGCIAIGVGLSLRRG